MHTGILWYDDGIRTPFESRLEKAVDHYRTKYGRGLNLCLVHPGMLGRRRSRIGQLIVRAYAPTPAGHLWIGIDDDEERTVSRRRQRPRMPAPGPRYA